jgi:hypothetical protein
MGVGVGTRIKFSNAREDGLFTFDIEDRFIGVRFDTSNLAYDRGAFSKKLYDVLVHRVDSSP